MRRKPTTMIIAVLGLVCLGVTGCGKMTQEKLVGKMDEAMIGSPSTYCETTLDLSSSYKMGVMGMDMSMDLDMSMDMKSWANNDPVASYMEGTIHMNVMEQEMDADMKTYMVPEDDKLVTYTYTDATNEWVYTDSGITLADYEEMKAIAEKPITELFSSVTMEEETTELNGKEVYVLHVTCTGEEIEALMGDYLGKAFASEDIDLDFSMEGLTAPATYYVDTETFLPVQIEMTIEGMDSLVNDILTKELGGLDESLAELGEEAAEAADEMDIAVEGTTCTMTMTNIGYGPQDIPAVPEEAKESIAFKEALEEIGSILEDGSYVLGSGGTHLCVPMPEGWMEQGINETDISFTNLTGTGMLTYAIIPEMLSETGAVDLSSYYEELFTSMGMTLEKGQTEQKITTAFGDVDAEWMGMDGLLISYMTIPLEGAELYVLAMDAGNIWGDANTALTAAMDGVRPLTYDDIK